MTTPSILDTFLTAFRDHTSATCGLDDRIARLTAELERVPESCPSARGYLSLEICRAKDEQDGAARSIALRAALILGCRTGNDGECNIDKPPKWPKGPPTKAENAARGNVGTEPPADPPPPTTTPETPTTGTDQGSGSAGEDAPPADDASGLAAAFEPANEWASCAIGKAHGHAIAVLGYTANELAGLGEVQIRAICKHRVAPAEFGGVVVGGVLVDGVAWLLEASARVVA